LNGQIGFLEIAGLVEEALTALPRSPIASLEEVVAHDQLVRRTAIGFAARANGRN